MIRRLSAFALAALAPTVAVAHPGDHDGMSAAEDLHHLLTQPDHLLALLGLVSLLVLGGRGAALALRRIRK